MGPVSSQETIDTNQVAVKTYELGFLLSPAVAADQVADTVEQDLAEVIKVAGGQILSQVACQRQTLAYPLAINREHKRHIFTEGYFGAIRFAITPEAIDQLDKKWRANQAILRFLLITLPAKAIKPVRAAKEKTKLAKDQSTLNQSDQSEPMLQTAVDEASIDKEIEDLLTANV